jgi:hypothetical protein
MLGHEARLHQRFDGIVHGLRGANSEGFASEPDKRTLDLVSFHSDVDQGR